MPFVTLIAEQHLVFTRKIEVSDEELAELQAQLAEGRQDVSHLVAEDHLSDENILEDSGYEAVRLVLH